MWASPTGRSCHKLTNEVRWVVSRVAVQSNISAESDDLARVAVKRQLEFVAKIENKRAVFAALVYLLKQSGGAKLYFEKASVRRHVCA